MSAARMCDQCKTVIAHSNAGVMLVEPDTAVLNPFLGNFRRHDMCSWKCAADYAMLRALDPAPERSEP